MEKTETICIRLSEKERRQIEEKMSDCNVQNMSAYIRKIAIDGMIIHLDMHELREISRLMRYNSNNINQIAKRLNEGRGAYASDIKDIKDKQTQITDMIREIYLKLSKL